MPKPKPRVERECLACGAVFIGTPKATRCDNCRATGRKVDRFKQLAQRKGETRSPEQIAAAAEARRLTDEQAKARRAELEVLRRETEQLVAERRENQPPPPTVEDEERTRREERLNRMKKRLAGQSTWLDARERRKPKGRPAMTNRTIKLPIGILWLQIVAADGAAHSVTYAGTTTEVCDEDKIALLTTYFRLRCRGYRPEALARLCPKALLQEATQGALDDLPEVTDGEPEEDADDQLIVVDGFELSSGTALELGLV